MDFTKQVVYCLFTTLMAYSGLACSFSVKDAVNVALKTNPRISAERANVAVTKYDANKSKGDFFPKVSLLLGRGTAKVINPSIIEAGIDPKFLLRQENAVVVEQLLFSGGQVINQYRQAKYTYRAADSQFLESRQAIALEAVQAYLDVLRVRQLLQISQINIDTQVRAPRNTGNISIFSPG